jgi:hypothetical protein
MRDRFEEILHLAILGRAHIRCSAYTLEEEPDVPEGTRRATILQGLGLSRPGDGGVVPVNRNPEVDRWFERKAPPQAEAMQRVRAIVLGADERVTESIKWQTPTFEFHGNIASFSPAKRFVSLMFHRGAEIPGNHLRLEGDGKLSRTMRFSDLADVEAGRKDLERVIRAWCKAHA